MSPEDPPAEFSSEATETAEALGRSLLLLEAGPEEADPDLLNAVFRHAHSLKGLAGCLDLIRRRPAPKRRRRCFDESSS